VPVDAHRGPILDRHGRLLAASISADCVGANPAEVRNPSATAAILAPILDQDAADLEARLKMKQSFVWLKRQVRKAEAEAIKAKNLPGIVVLPKAQRFYPKNLAGQVLGFAGIDNQGLEGLEVFYDANLRGQRGWDMAEFSALGRHIPGGERRFQEPVDGDTLYLTLDERLQFIAERELDRAVAETGARRGIIILMNPDGEILAMANRPQLDPNNFMDFPQEVWKNISVTDQFEPGSIFKVVTAAAALEEGVVNPRSTFFDPGFLTVDDRHLHCWYPGGHGSQTFVEAIENSCNPVFASLALSLGASTFARYVKAFGFGGRTGLDFPGEATGTVPKVEKLKRVELATMGFGQGISVTPLQMVVAMNAVANGGYLVQPHLMKKLVSPSGRLLRQSKREPIRQVISGSTARTMRNLLESVVLNGSGNRAAIPGYRVAGKTGTAQKPSRGAYGSEVVASFLGFAPADRPSLVGLVMLDEPSCGVRYGGVIAAPVFARVVGSALRLLNVPATVDQSAQSEQGGLVRVPNLINLPPGDAQATLARAGLQAASRGRGSYVFDQVPKPGARVARGTTVLLYFDPAEKYNRFDEQAVVVPDLSGLKPDAVNKILTGNGLRFLGVGEGLARDQEPAAGTMVRPGTPVTVRFVPPERH
ncbi:MAG: penicillin-binding transpeptidase domain-containing protein, partial [Bacteroidota bacterium]